MLKKKQSEPLENKLIMFFYTKKLKNIKRDKVVILDNKTENISRKKSIRMNNKRSEVSTRHLVAPKL